LSPMNSWPQIDYFHSGQAKSKAKLASLELVAEESWRQLYRHKTDGTYWRLDTEDKFQERFLVRIEDPSSWSSFDATSLEKSLLLSNRGGLASEKCLMGGCAQRVIVGSAFCLDHTYAQGVRK
jgi:hypothetical protein